MKQKKWEFIYNEHVGDLSIVDENGDTILNNKFSPQSSPDGRIPCDVRDWRLIAAAPQMLEALEKFTKIEYAMGKDLTIYGNTYVPEEWLQFLTIARDIIANVKGENQ
jgi:hypothetical protein